MKNFFASLFIVLVFVVAAFAQQMPTVTATPNASPVVTPKPKSDTKSAASTTVNLSIDNYDWNKIVVSHFFDKSNGIGFQFWYKNSTDAKRMRLYYQRKFAYNKGANNVQFVTGIGLQGTSRKRSSISYQILVPNDFQYKRKLNKDLTFNFRAANFLSVSPTAKQGDHTDKFITDAGFKYQKFNVYYHADYLMAFKTGMRENLQGVGFTYDVTKKVTLGALPYTDLKQRDKKFHLGIIAIFKL